MMLRKNSSARLIAGLSFLGLSSVMGLAPAPAGASEYSYHGGYITEDGACASGMAALGATVKYKNSDGNPIEFKTLPASASEEEKEKAKYEWGKRKIDSITFEKGSDAFDHRGDFGSNGCLRLDANGCPQNAPGVFCSADTSAKLESLMKSCGQVPGPAGSSPSTWGMSCHTGKVWTSCFNRKTKKMENSENGPGEGNCSEADKPLFAAESPKSVDSARPKKDTGKGGSAKVTRLSRAVTDPFTSSGTPAPTFSCATDPATGICLPAKLVDSGCGTKVCAVTYKMTYEYAPHKSTSWTDTAVCVQTKEDGGKCPSAKVCAERKTNTSAVEISDDPTPTDPVRAGGAR